MARALRNYQRVDYTELLEELNGKIPSDNATSASKEDACLQQSSPTVSLAKRKRDSLMGNQRMRYAFSDREQVIHDRDCIHVSAIKDEDFRMREDFSADMQYCMGCHRMAVVRAGIHYEDTKHLRTYMGMFKSFGATNKDLYWLFIENGAHLCGVGPEGVSFKVHDDMWHICSIDGAMLLYHNNYEIVGDYERIMGKGFHLQWETSGVGSFRRLIDIACGYSWPAHVEWLKTQKALDQFGDLPETEPMGFWGRGKALLLKPLRWLLANFLKEKEEHESA